METSIQNTPDRFSLLMIEDNVHDVFLTKEMFGVIRSKKMIDFEIESCGTIESIPEDLSKFNIVFLDLNLPSYSGLETLDKVLEIINDIPIIVLTGLENESMGLECIKRGASDYMVKWDISNTDLLYKTIKYALERYTLLKSLKFKNEELNKQLRIIEEKQQRLNAIVETSVDGIITLTENGEIVGANEAACKLFGFNFTKFINKKLLNQLELPEGFTLEGESWEVFNDLALIYIIKADLSRAPAKISTKKIAVEKGNIIIVIIKDMSTELLAKETQVALSKQKELNELKSRFISIASHEFRTPLSTISSSTTLVKMYDNNEEYEEKRLKHLERIQASVRHMVHILEDFLSLSRLEEGKNKIMPMYFDINEFGKDLAEEMELSAKPGQTIAYKHSGDRKLFHDKKMFTIIFYNIVGNAIKYSGENSTVIFNTKLENEKLFVEVTDTGIGIPKEEFNQLFTRFFRAQNATNIDGTGLGLNIVKRYVDLLNGDIRIESEINEGTSVFLEFNISYE